VCAILISKIFFHSAQKRRRLQPAQQLAPRALLPRSRSRLRGALFVALPGGCCRSVRTASYHWARKRSVPQWRAATRICRRCVPGTAAAAAACEWRATTQYWSRGDGVTAGHRARHRHGNPDWRPKEFVAFTASDGGLRGLPSVTVRAEAHLYTSLLRTSPTIRFGRRMAARREHHRDNNAGPRRRRRRYSDHLTGGDGGGGEGGS
jgi:hypothetical protein